MKKYSIYAFLILIVVFLSFSVSAESNGNNYIDFNEYATYSYSDDNTSVIADVVFPDFLNNTFVATGGREYWFTGNSFVVNNLGYQMKIRMYPISGYTNDNMGVGVQLSDTNILDLRYIPSGTSLTYSFSVGLSTDDRTISENTKVFRAFYYVDRNGLIIEDARHYFYPTLNRGIYTWEETVTLNVPAGAVGLIPQFWISELPVWDDSCTFVLNPFRFELPMSALQFESMQNQQIKNTLDNIEDSIGELVNGKPVPEKSPIDDSVNEMIGAEEELLDSTQLGRENVITYITQAISEVTAYATAFIAVSGLLDGFFFMPIVGPLITISLALGIFALIVNLGQTLERSDRASKSKVKKGGKSK